MDSIDYSIIGVTIALLLVGIGLLVMSSTRIIGMVVLGLAMIMSGFAVWWILFREKKKPVEEEPIDSLPGDTPSSDETPSEEIPKCVPDKDWKTLCPGDSDCCNTQKTHLKQCTTNPITGMVCKYVPKLNPSSTECVPDSAWQTLCPGDSGCCRTQLTHKKECTKKPFGMICNYIPL